MHLKWVDILKWWMAHLGCELRMEAMKSGNLLASMQGAFGSWQRERCADAHVERRRMEVTGLRVVNGVGAAGRRRVIARHVVRKHAEAIAVRIHEGRCQAGRAEGPRLVVGLGRGIRFRDNVLHIMRLICCVVDRPGKCQQ